MVKLTRFTMPIFAGNAEQTQTSVFGTMKTSPQYTSDVAISIGTTAYGNGWADAIEIGYAPFMEDMNTLQRAITYQIAYNQQQGLPEWDSSTEYYKDSLAKYNSESGAQVYVSLADNNVGNLVSDTTKWKLVLDTANSYVTTNTAQTITDVKTFSVSPLVPNVASGDSSTKAANTAFVTGLTDNLQAQINQKANASDVVTLTTSQTITGTKNFTARLRRQSNEITKGVAPASTVNTVIAFIDKDGASLGNVYHSYNNDKISAMAIQAIKANTSSDTDYASVAVFYPASGNPYATAPASDLSNSIVTTVNKSKSANGYFKLGNGMIVQWGRIKVSVHPSKPVSTITLPSAFSTTNYTFCACFENNTSSQTTYTDDVSFVTTSISTTQVKGFGFDAGGNAYDAYIRWTAIGY